MGMTFKTWLETERVRYGNVKFSPAERTRLERAWDAAIESTKESTLTTCVGLGGGAAEANAKHIEATLGPHSHAAAQRQVVYSKVDRLKEETSEECVMHTDTNLRVKKTAIGVPAMVIGDHFGYGYMGRSECEDR